MKKACVNVAVTQTQHAAYSGSFKLFFFSLDLRDETHFRWISVLHTLKCVQETGDERDKVREGSKV